MLNVDALVGRGIVLKSNGETGLIRGAYISTQKDELVFLIERDEDNKLIECRSSDFTLIRTEDNWDIR